MITHEIQVVKEPDPPARQSMWPWAGQTQRPREMTKLEYALYIEGIKSQFKVGDILINNYDKYNNRAPVNELAKGRFYVLSDINEIHSSVRYMSGKPECLYVKNINSLTYGYWSNPDSFDVVSYDELPDAVKQYVDSRNSNQSSPAEGKAH
ncbi:MAG TPA: hypothetical protein VFM18_11495 [Methanosarcina sp.]|nr:hypothetical protein [Methanosarcina sp.]